MLLALASYMLAPPLSAGVSSHARNEASSRGRFADPSYKPFTVQEEKMEHEERRPCVSETFGIND